MATGEKQADDAKEVGDPKEADSPDAGLKDVRRRRPPHPPARARAGPWGPCPLLLSRWITLTFASSSYVAGTMLALPSYLKMPCQHKPGA